jgi:tetratricopeptide (TPR) repeat protein
LDFYIEQGQDLKSIQYLDLACQKEPFVIKAYYNYPLKLYKLKRYNKEKEVINKVLKYSPNNKNILYINILLQIKTEDIENGRKTSKILMKISPDNPNYKKTMADLQNK